METISRSMIENIAVTVGILDSREIRGPLQRWLEYMAYLELKEWLLSIGELPEELIDEEFSVDAIKDWVTGEIASNSFNFREKIENILFKLKEAGSNGIDDLCRRYCEHKQKMSLGADGASLLLSFNGVKEMIMDSVLDALIFSGVPVSLLISFLLRSGILDKLCDCENLLGERHSKA
ncbi:hypothetical protein [Rheinheimera sp.]|uniref:hypothetical protein n=1 Tax=Rheinheimera sp. TaxID=1869214 RepID=UPI00273481F2|nr:hypothetical protein [Rheinheimera sp.]MDP2714416.1 hypothetical protein [Rheinheimera sp.]